MTTELRRRRIRRIYVAGPITNGNRMDNVNEAIAVGNELRDMGFNPFVPHLSHFWNERHPRDYEDWMEVDFDWIDVCPALYRIRFVKGEVVPSSGADREIVYADKHGVVVFDEAELGRAATLLRAKEWIERQRRVRAAATVHDLRPEVRAFALGMENRLRDHDKTRGPTGWHLAEPNELMTHLAEEAGAVAAALRHDGLDLGPECFDVGNMAMMIADVTGNLRDEDDGD